jgi:hypothetical protein
MFVVLLAMWTGSAMAMVDTNGMAPAATNRAAAVSTNGAAPAAIVGGSALPTFTSRNPVSTNFTISNPPVPTTRVPSRRYSGKLLGVDTNAHLITLQGGEKAGIGITDKTQIVKDKQMTNINALAVGMSVSGMERRDATGKWNAETLNVGDTRQPMEEEPTVIPVAANKKDEATASIHILVSGSTTDEDWSFGSMPAQPGIVRTNTLSRRIAGSLQGAVLLRSIRVDGAAVVPWYSNVADQDVIVHVTPGKHVVNVVLKNSLTEDTSDQPIAITVTLKDGETQMADFR